MFLCPWDFPGKNIGVGCHFLLQGIFPTQGWNQCLLHCLHRRWILYHLGSPVMIGYTFLSRRVPYCYHSQRMRCEPVSLIPCSLHCCFLKSTATWLHVGKQVTCQLHKYKHGDPPQPRSPPSVSCHRSLGEQSPANTWLHLFFFFFLPKFKWMECFNILQPFQNQGVISCLE